MNEEQKALGRKILARIDANPEVLHMATWESLDIPLYNWKTDERSEQCGTTRCMAGWAIHEYALPGESLRETRDRIAEENGLASGSYSHVGAFLLGLNRHTANDLFLLMDEQEAVDRLRSLVEAE